MNLAIPDTQPRPASSPISLPVSNIIREGDVKLLLEDVKREDPELAKFMQAFVDCLPADGAKTFRQDLLKLGNVQQLSQHRDSLMSGPLAPLKNKGKTPKASTSPIEELEMEVQSLSSTLHAFDPPKCEDAVRQISLKRDGYRCVATGVYDESSWDQLDSKMQMEVGFHAPTKLAHVLPFSLSKSSPGSDENKARVWTFIHRYFPSVGDLTRHGTVDGPSNALTLMTLFHHAFDDFLFTIEPTDANDVYACKTYGPEAWRETWFATPFIRETVELDDHGTGVALPSRALLGLHAAVAKILHLTAAGEQIERVLRDYDENLYLARDGTADVGNIMRNALYRDSFNVQGQIVIKQDGTGAVSKSTDHSLVR